MKLNVALQGFIVAATLGLALTQAHAEDKTDCAVTTARTACPGQEAESYKKCDGQKSCTKYLPADSEQACQTAAVSACSNDRPSVTDSKVITVTWKGKPLKSKAGKPDLCLDYGHREVEFNQCSKK